MEEWFPNLSIPPLPTYCGPDCASCSHPAPFPPLPLNAVLLVSPLRCMLVCVKICATACVCYMCFCVWYKHSSSSFWSPAGLITFFSFLVLGSIPLLSYVAFLIAHGGDVNEKINSDEFWVAAGLTVLTLLIVGAIKSRLESQRWWVSALLTLLIGAGSAGSGFLVAFILQSATGTTGG